LTTIQKRAIRIINNKPFRAHTEPLFKKEKIQKLTDMYNSQVQLFMHDYLHNNLPNSFTNLFQNKNTSSMRTRYQENNLYMEQPQNNFSEKLPKHNFRCKWNELDNELKTIQSRETFKRTIKNKNINEYAEHIKCNNTMCIECTKKIK
jgi:hypothetical protein